MVIEFGRHLRPRSTYATARRSARRSIRGRGSSAGSILVGVRNATLVLPAGGEIVGDSAGRRVEILSDDDTLHATWSRFGPRRVGADLHVHREHTDAWIVLEGTLTLRLRDDASIEAGPGTLVVVPPHVAHGFANEGEVATRFLNLHIPSCGFGAYLRGDHPGFDQHEPPPDGGADPSAVLVRALA